MNYKTGKYGKEEHKIPFHNGESTEHTKVVTTTVHEVSGLVIGKCYRFKASVNSKYELTQTGGMMFNSPANAGGKSG